MRNNNQIKPLININKDKKKQIINTYNISTKIKLSRNSSFELLRIFLIILIIFFHIKYYGKSIPSMNNRNYKQLINKNYILLRIISNYGIFGDILFIMMSGYFSVRNKNFHITKFLLISSETYTYHFLFLYISIKLKDIYKDVKMPNFKYINRYFPLISNEGHWFTQHYLLILIFMPFINTGLLSLNSNQYKMLVVLIIILFCIIKALVNICNISSNLFTLNKFMKLLFPYIIGGYIKIFDLKLNIFWKLAGVFFFILTIFFEILFDYFSIHFNNYIWIIIKNEFCLQIYSVFPILSSIGIINLIKKIEIYNKSINFISSSVLGIYLIHANKYIAPFVYNSIFKTNYYTQEYFFLIFFLNAFKIFIICLLLDILRRYTIGLLINGVLKELIKYLNFKFIKN